MSKRPSSPLRVWQEQGYPVKQVMLAGRVEGVGHSIPNVTGRISVSPTWGFETCQRRIPPLQTALAAL